MRKELNNTFTDGLIKDLNPINTPNTVLTDCLNGTILTYNGNEYSLQNDMGNYALEHCKLPENYVPVAIKEYGDILYILSYNPIAKKTQIGSYPSIRQIVKNRDNSGQNHVKALPYTDESINYTEIVDNNEITIIYDDEYKINPGDKIQITESSSSNEGAPEFTTTRYYIMDSDKMLYDITDQIDKFVEASDPELITWQMPGWLCAKIVPFKLDKCDIVVGSNSYYNQITKTGELHLKYIAESSDKNFNDKYYNDSPYTFSVDVTYNDQVNPSSTYPERFNKRVDYDSSMVYYTNDDSKSISINNNNPNPIKVTVTPKLVTNGKTLKYDNLTVTKEFPLGTRIDINEVKLGEDVWKWDVSQDYITLHLSISDLSSFGLPNAGGEIQLWYKIYKYDYDPDPDSDMLDEDYLCKSNVEQGCDFSFGQTIDLEVNFDPDTDNISDIDDNSDTDNISDVDASPKFKKENIYLVHFWIGPSTGSESNPNYPQVWRPLITSEVFNNIAESRYDTLYLDDWVGAWLDKADISVTYTSNEGNWGDFEITQCKNYNTLIEYTNSSLYNPDLCGFIPTEKLGKSIENYTSTIEIGRSSTITPAFTASEIPGELWNSFINGKSFYCDDKKVNNNTSYTFKTSFKKNIQYDFEKQFSKDVNVWEYTTKSLSSAEQNLSIKLNGKTNFNSFTYGDIFTEAAYKWCQLDLKNLIKYNTNSSYGTVDNKTVLEPEDDAAHVNWEGAWRMPTIDEWSELLELPNEFKKIGFGRYGIEFTGNGNHIFIPCIDTKFIDDDNWYSYWSSSLNENECDKSQCVALSVDSSDIFSNPTNAHLYSTNSKRHYGLLIRPVLPANGNANGHEAVDLGLSVKWATCNVGVNDDTDLGNFFAWGETNNVVPDKVAGSIILSNLGGKSEEFIISSHNTDETLLTVEESNMLKHDNSMAFVKGSFNFNRTISALMSDWIGAALIENCTKTNVCNDDKLIDIPAGYTNSSENLQQNYFTMIKSDNVYVVPIKSTDNMPANLNEYMSLLECLHSDPGSEIDSGNFYLINMSSDDDFNKDNINYISNQHVKYRKSDLLYDVGDNEKIAFTEIQLYNNDESYKTHLFEFKPEFTDDNFVKNVNCEGGQPKVNGQIPSDATILNNLNIEVARLNGIIQAGSEKYSQIEGYFQSISNIGNDTFYYKDGSSDDTVINLLNSTKTVIDDNYAEGELYAILYFIVSGAWYGHICGQSKSGNMYYAIVSLGKTFNSSTRSAITRAIKLKLEQSQSA